jgi:hypothetical protein
MISMSVREKEVAVFQKKERRKSPSTSRIGEIATLPTTIKI